MKLETPTPIRYARNNREIARALGLKLSRKQLTEIGHWRQRPDFPKRDAKGWTHIDLMAWGRRVAPEFAQQRSLANLLSSTKPPTLKDLKLVREISAGSGPGLDGGEYPAKANGQPAIAALINHRFKIRCTRQDIQKWRKAAPVPFPAPDERNDYDVPECFAWVDKYKMPTANGNGTTPDLFARAAEVTAQGEIEEVEHERWLREVERGAWIKRDTIGSVLAGLGKQTSAAITRGFEVTIMSALDDELKLIAELNAAQRATILDRLRKTAQRVNDTIQQGLREGGEAAAHLKLET